MRRWVPALVVAGAVVAGGWWLTQRKPERRTEVLGVQVTPPIPPEVRARYPEERIAQGVTRRLKNPDAGTADAVALGLSRFVPVPQGRKPLPERANAMAVFGTASDGTFLLAQATASPSPSPSPRPLLLSEGFTSFTTGQVLVDGKQYGQWLARYNGYGRTTTVVDGTKALEEAPAVSSSPDVTHASLVTSVPKIGAMDLSLTLRTVKQLRMQTPPNPWEVAWLIWNYTSDGAFYYFIPKPNGWELGKVDASKLDPAGPACVWPEYLNCKYPGGQRYLATGSTPKYTVGPWRSVRVIQKANVIQVYVGSGLLVTYTDADNPYLAGSIGLYNEDARVRFDSLTARQPA